MSIIVKPHFENDDILVPRRSKEERNRNYRRIIQKRIDQYVKNGMNENLDLFDSPITVFNPLNLEKVGRSLKLTYCQYLHVFNPPNLTEIDRNLDFHMSVNLLHFNPVKLKRIGRTLNLQNTLFARRFSNSNECREYLFYKFELIVEGKIFI